MYMDRHSAVDATPEQVAEAHQLDLSLQEQLGVKYHSYWFNPESRTVFCLAEGPNQEAVIQVHAETHGMLADKIIEVDPEMVDAIIGDIPRHPPGTAYTASALRAILFTDMCESTETTSRLGDDVEMQLVHVHDETVRRLVKEHGGRCVKHTGDGLMASFFSVAAAVQTAIAIHREFELRNEGTVEPLRVRIGISAGEPITEGDDLFGAAVQLAARLCAWTTPGGIAVSAPVRDLCAGKQLPFSERKTVQLKGFPGRQPVFQVDWHQTAS
jgi:class 3 adenylate cyclase